MQLTEIFFRELLEIKIDIFILLEPRNKNINKKVYIVPVFLCLCLNCNFQPLVSFFTFRILISLYLVPANLVANFFVQTHKIRQINDILPLAFEMSYDIQFLFEVTNILNTSLTS